MSDFENDECEDSNIEPVDGHYIGIDLGTTNSVVSYFKDNKVKTLRIKNNEVIPSVIFFESSSKIIYGKKALAKGLEYPQSVARLFKRKLKDKKDKIQIEFYERNHIVSEAKIKTGGKTYIIDTNIFIDEPHIISKFQEDDKIVVSMKVIDELNYRKANYDTEYQAREAIKSILNIKEKIIFESSDISLLPDDLDPRDNDNLILSIALKLKEKSPVLLTSDKNFQLKCQGIMIPFQSLNDFLLYAINPGNKKEIIEITGEEASALFLRYLKDEATKELGPVTRAVITVPANFNHAEIEATKRAGENAGFKEVKIYKEPSAAAIAYGLETEENKNILVYDFGGGTFDVSIIEAKNDKTFRVINTGGDSCLGGEDLTLELVGFIYDNINDNLNIDMTDVNSSNLTYEEYIYNKATVYKEAERVKVNLSEAEEDEISLLNFYIKKGEQKSYSIKITRSEFEDLVRDKVKKTLDILDNTIVAASLQVEDIDIIVLAGGTSLMPIIQDRVRKYFGKSPNYEKNTATVISHGAAILADSEWQISEDGIQEKIQIYEKTVADFGVSVKGRRFDCLIEADTELPVRVEKDYSLVKDNQENLQILIFRRNKFRKDAKRTFDEGIDFIDEIFISNLPPMKKTEAEIKVIFELSKEDILNIDVKVKDINGNLLDSRGIKIQKSSMVK